MTEAVGERPSRSRLAWLLAPAVAIERARGRRRVLLLTAYGGVVAALLAGMAWAGQLRGLPDVGDPFDLAALKGGPPLADDRNSFVPYAEAARLLRPIDPEAWEGVEGVAGRPWAEIPPGARAWLEANRPALEVWRRGTERPDARLLPMWEYRLETLLHPAQELRTFARLAMLEAARLREAGDMAGAWGWYDAVLRSSRHVGRGGGMVQRLIGSAIAGQVEQEVESWAADPRTTPAQVRGAMADLAAADRLTPPISEAYRVEYLMVINALGDREWPGWIDEEIRTGGSSRWYDFLPGSLPVRRLIGRERERSRRVTRLVFANWLAHCDDPVGSRPAWVGVPDGPGLELFPTTPADPPAARALSPRALGRWWNSTLGARLLIPSLLSARGALAGDQLRLGGIRLALANQLYARDHGGETPPTYRALVDGGYIEAVPEGFVDVASPTPDETGPIP